MQTTLLSFRFISCSVSDPLNSESVIIYDKYRDIYYRFVDIPIKDQ